MAKNFNYQKALDDGIPPEAIAEHLSQEKGFNLQKAREDGIPDIEIIKHLSIGEERSSLEKAGRTALQFGTGVVEGMALPYDIVAAPLASEEMQTQAYRGNLMDDIERLLEQKQTGVWDESDQEFLDNLMEQMKDPRKSQEFVQTSDVTSKDLIEKVTGVDLEPEGVLEETANLIGLVKNPRKLLQAGLNPTNIFRAIAPTGKEVLKGVGMEAGLLGAREGDFGPAGTIAMMVLGDIAGEGVAGGVKAALSPKKTVAKFMANRANKEMAKELVKDLRASGIKADLGTLTDSDLVKMVQTKLDQSGLTGDALNELRQTIFQDIKNEYGAVAEGINEYKFATRDEAGKTLQNAVEEARTKDLDEVRDIYKRARENVVDTESVNVSKLNRLVDSIESDLAKGSVKSAEQQKVLDLLETLKGDIRNEQGVLKNASPVALMNNKIALNDIINYETQGGTKQLLKGLVGEIDRALQRHGARYDKNFLRDYTAANKRFKKHAETFRNKNISKLLRNQNPETILKQMDTLNGINQLEKALSRTQEGREVFDQLKRQKLDDMFAKSMVNSLEDQLKLGKFKSVLDNPKNAEIAKKLLGKDQYSRLKRLSKNANKIQQASAKFLNPSKSGVVISDIAAVSKLLSDFGHLFYGNPFPLMKSGSIGTGARYLTNLMADPEFITLVEELILADSKNQISKVNQLAERLRPYAAKYSQSSEE